MEALSICACVFGFAAAEEPNPLLHTLEKRYAFAVEYPAVRESGFSSVTFESLTPKDSVALEKYSWVLAEEINKYPPAFIRKVGIASVSLVKNLQLEGDERSAIPDYKKGVLYLDVYAGANAANYRRHVIHHEMYHLIEAKLNGNAFFKDPAWAALNPSDFHYGEGGSHARGADQAVLDHPLPGFIDKYAASGLEEDKAEVFACLFVPAENRKLQEMASSDSVIAAKVAFLKSACRAWCPEMDENFWTRLHRRR